MKIPTGSWRVRIANVDTPRDVLELSQLRFAWRRHERHEGGMAFEQFHPRFEGWMKDHQETHLGFLGSLEGEAIAMAWLAVVDRVPGPEIFVRRCAYIQSVYVAPAHRDAGHGAALMEAVLEEARALKLDYLAVHPSPASFSFYRRLGFDETTRVLELDLRGSSTT